MPGGLRAAAGAALPLAQPSVYTVPVVIDNTANTAVLTDYQVKLTFNTRVPIAQDDMRGDCGDIRFYDSDQVTNLDYWLESGCNTSTTLIWTKVPTIAASDLTTIYLTYGDSGLTSAGDGAAVFDLFDDFEDGDISDWTSSPITAGIITAVDGKVKIRERANYHANIRKPWSGSLQNHVIEGLIEYDSNEPSIGESWFPRLTAYITPGTQVGVGPVQYSAGTLPTDRLRRAHDGGLVDIVATNYGGGSRIEIRLIFGANQYTFASRLEGTSAWDGQTTINYTVSRLDEAQIVLGKEPNNDDYPPIAGSIGTHYWDSIRVRKYTAPEPTATAVLSPTFGTPAELDLSSAAEVTLLTPFTATLAVRDETGLIVTNYTRTVTLTVSTASNDFPVSHVFTDGDDGIYDFTALTLNASGLQTVTVTDGVLTGTGVLTVDGMITLDQDTTWDEEVIALESLVVTGTGTVLTLTKATTLTANTIMVGAGAQISADGQGYGSGMGPGAPAPRIPDGQSGSGAGHGGRGGYGGSGLAPGEPYGSIYEPTDLGSGGGAGDIPGGAGGGAIHLAVTDGFTLNGTLSANGLAGTQETFDSSGGGSGGSIWLEILHGTLTGTGGIQADGGNGAGGLNGNEYSGSGGGGRIAIYGDRAGFSQNIRADGGVGGTQAGYPGTIYLGYVDPLTSTIASSPPAVPANGIAAGVMTVTLRTITGSLIVGEPVSIKLALSGGDDANTYVDGQRLSLGPADIGLTNANGQATAIMTSTTAETKTIEAYSGLVRLVTPTQLYFDPDVVDAAASAIAVQGSSTVAADGSETATVVVTARDRFNNLIPDLNVTLVTSPSITVTPSSISTDMNGEAIFQVSHDSPVVAVISATIASSINLTQTINVTFQGPELSISKSGPTEVTASYPLTYTISFENGGLLTATNVVISDTFPLDAVDLITQTSAYTFSQDGDHLTWEVGDLAPAEMGSFALTGTVYLTAPTVITNRVSISTTDIEFEVGNNQATWVATVLEPQPEVSISPSEPTLAFKPGQSREITLTVQNSGTDLLTGLAITAPAVMPWVTLSPGHPTSLLPGNQTVITLTASPDSGVAVGTYRDFVTATEADGGERRAILRVDLLPTTRTLNITVNNTQDNPVSGAVVSLVQEDGLIDVTPAFTLYRDIHAGGPTSPTGTLTLADLPLGTYSYLIQADDHQTASGSFALVDDTGPQSEVITLTAQPRLTITPAEPLLAVAAGQIGSVALTIRNEGVAPLSGLSLAGPTNPDWLHLITPATLNQTLPPGGSIEVTILASPPVTQANTVFTDKTITASANGGQQATASLTLQVTDQMTGEIEVEVTNRTGDPLAEASVTLVRQALITEVTASGVVTYHQQFTQRTLTGSNIVTFNDLPVGGYNYRITRSGYKTANGTLQVQPIDELIAASSGSKIALSSPNSMGLAQAAQQGRVVVALNEAPFNYSWQVIRTTVGYTIELLITQNNDAEGLSLVAPARQWTFATCDTDTLNDNILLLNPSSSVMTLTEVTVSVPGVDVTVNSFPSQLAANGQGQVSVTGVRSSDAIGQGTIDLEGFYDGIDSDLVAFTLNPSSFTQPGLQPDQQFSKTYILTPTVFSPGANYTVTLTQPDLLEPWISLNAPEQVTGGSSMAITTAITPPTWLQSAHVYTTQATITLTDPNGNSRAGNLIFEVMRNASGIQLHTSFVPGPTPVVKLPLSASGEINAKVIQCGSSGGGGSGSTGADGGGWSWSPVSGGGSGYIGTQPGNGGSGSGSTHPVSGATGSPGEVTGEESQEVRLALSQGLMLEGESFQASLILTSRSETLDVTDIAVDLVISDTTGADVTDQFEIQPATPTNLDPLPADGQVVGNWLIVPAMAVTDSEGQDFLIQATIDYTFNGNSYSFATIPEQITVFPASELVINYTLPEPTQVCTIFDLKARVQNQGMGPARNARLVSGQPRIVAATGGSQGFEIVSVTVNSQTVSAATQVTLGNIAPGDEAEVVWRIQAVQPGRFIEFSSNYQMNTYLGDALAPSLRAINTTFDSIAGIQCEASSGSKTYSISGVITDDSDQPLSDVTVSTNVGTNTTTDATGTYTLTGLIGGTYTIVPSADGIIFTPAQQSIAVVTDTTGIDFVGVPGTTYTISGHVFDENSNALAQVTVASSSGINTTTDANGAYTLPGLTDDVYMVLPTLPGYTFLPVAGAANLPPDADDVDFVATISSGSLTISGIVTDENDQGLAGVIVSSSAGTNTTTDANGAYTLSNLAAGSYTIVPAADGYLFTPASQVVDVQTDVIGVNFSGQPGTTYSVSGEVQDADGNPIPNLTILSSAGTNTTTDSAGTYSLIGLQPDNYYNILPHNPGVTFQPPAYTLLVNQDRTGIDFTQIGQTPPTGVEIQILQPQANDQIAVGQQPVTLRVQVYDRYPAYIVRPVEVIVTYLDGIDPETSSPHSETVDLEATGATNGVWDEYETEWSPRYPGQITLTAVVTVGPVQASETVGLSLYCATPLPDLLTIGTAMSTEILPATDRCGSRFEELIIISPTDTTDSPGTDGTYAFQQFADLALNAKYEVLFANMSWDPRDLSENTAASIFFGEQPGSGLLGLYNNVRDSYDSGNLDNYPYGMTVRILMGNPKFYSDNIPGHPKEIVVQELFDLGIPLQYPGGVSNPYWKLEVADYPKVFNFHSHVKTMIVDGRTVIAGGYNMQNRYFEDPVVQDMGVKLSGEIAQKSLEMFDTLWQGAIVCTEYDEAEEECQEETVSEATHPDPVSNPSITGQGINAFPLYRDFTSPQSEYAIYEAMAESTDQINLLQDRLYSSIGLEGRYYLRGIWEALKKGSTIQYIFNCEPGLCLTNIVSYHDLKSQAAEYDEENGTNLYQRLQAKTAKGPIFGLNHSSFLHTKATSIDGEMLIVGSMNMDFSSWGANAAQNLAEYDIAIDNSDVTGTYDQFFNGEWNNQDKYTLVDPENFSGQNNQPGVYNIQDLVNQAPPNAIILLPEGLYQETVVISKPLHLVGASGQGTIIEPPQGGQPAFQITSSNVTIYHLTIRGSEGFGIELIDSSASSLENIFIRKVLFDDNALGGISIEGLILGSPINYVIENNTFIGGQYGVEINILEQQVTTSTLRNNLFFEQSAVPIKIDSAHDGGVEYSYNLFNNCIRMVNDSCPQNWYEGTLSLISADHHNLLNLEPGFTSLVNGDYTLLPASPLIDAGNASTLNEVGLDGRIPQRADIGAFESELVIQPPGDFFQEASGQVVMEAEHFSWYIRRGQKVWLTQANGASYTGSGYLSVLPDTGLQLALPDTSVSSELQYTIDFTTTGTFYIWLRGYAPDGGGDSLYLNLNNQPLTTSLTLTGFAPDEWSWANNTLQNGVATIQITEPGQHTLYLWPREDGLRIDRILLTTESNYIPTGNGPIESDRGGAN